MLSTQTACVQVTNDLLPASDTGLSSFFISLVVSFDTVDHIGSLQNLNVPSSCVPQGSILDPLLLTIFCIYKCCLLRGWSPIICPGKAWYHRCILRYVLLLWKLDWDGQNPPCGPSTTSINNLSCSLGAWSDNVLLWIPNCSQMLNWIKLYSPAWSNWDSQLRSGHSLSSAHVEKVTQTFISPRLGPISIFRISRRNIQRLQ